MSLNLELRETIRNGPDDAVLCYIVTLTLYYTITINVCLLGYINAMTECDQQKILLFLAEFKMYLL